MNANSEEIFAPLIIYGPEMHMFIRLYLDKQIIKFK